MNRYQPAVGRTLLFAAVLPVLLAGCGSTADLTGSGAANGFSQGSGSDGSRHPAAARANGQQGASDAGQITAPGGQSGGAATGSTTAGIGGTTGNTGAPQPSLSTHPPAIAPKGRGWDATHVYIGVATQKDLGTAFHAAGFAGLDLGDAQGVTNAILADINKHGGILGRQVVAIYKDSPTYSASAQSVCTYFTQDSQVIAVENMAISLNQDTLNACLKKGHLPVYTSDFKNADDQFERTYAPYWYNIPMASYDRVTPLWLKRLDALHYYTGWDTANGKPSAAPTKIGLLYPQSQPASRIFDRLKTKLGADGHPVTSAIKYDDTSTQNEEAAMNNAVLTFRNLGVTHVFTDTDSTSLLFMEAAEQQHFRPRYAMSSYHAPEVLLSPNVPQQMAGTAGIGWLPTADVAAAQDPGSVGPAQTRCAEDMKVGAQDISHRSAQLAAYIACDMVRLPLESAVAGNGFDYVSLHTGVAALGRRFQSASTFASGLSGDRYDLPGAARDFWWDTGCTCIRYGKTTYPL